ncbi:MAG: hypothetical protein N2510_00390 [Ignavibacteria bacterium]|nr:hypothetical protein [Ignavibacteria bacterium]
MKNSEFIRKDLSIIDSVIFKLEPAFVNMITEDYPSLTEEEIKILILIKNNFSEEEMARFISLTEDETVSAVSKLNRKLRKNYNISIKKLLNIN